MFQKESICVRNKNTIAIVCVYDIIITQLLQILRKKLANVKKYGIMPLYYDNEVFIC